MGSPWLTYICVYGLADRGVVFVVVDVLFAYTGFRIDPVQAGALVWLRQLPGGAIILVLIALEPGVSGATFSPKASSAAFISSTA